jgi:hypothetical protein
MPTYSTEDIAWTALYFSIFAILLIVFVASFSFCMWQPAPPPRQSRVIKHIILTPGDSASPENA